MNSTLWRIFFSDCLTMVDHVLLSLVNEGFTREPLDGR